MSERFLKYFTKTCNEITSQRLIRNSLNQNNSLISKSLKLRDRSSSSSSSSSNYYYYYYYILLLFSA